jgi:hypothetical protein
MLDCGASDGIIQITMKRADGEEVGRNSWIGGSIANASWLAIQALTSKLAKSRLGTNEMIIIKSQGHSCFLFFLKAIDLIEKDLQTEKINFCRLSCRIGSIFINHCNSLHWITIISGPLDISSELLLEEGKWIV